MFALSVGSIFPYASGQTHQNSGEKIETGSRGSSTTRVFLIGQDGGAWQDLKVWLN